MIAGAAHEPHAQIGGRLRAAHQTLDNELFLLAYGDRVRVAGGRRRDVLLVRYHNVVVVVGRLAAERGGRRELNAQLFDRC